MTHTNSYEAFDRTVRDLRGNQVFSPCITINQSGDFHKITEIISDSVYGLIGYISSQKQRCQ